MTATQKANEVITQLNTALLQKDQLEEQLEFAVERVKALRNVLAGIQLGREMSQEQMGNGSVD